MKTTIRLYTSDTTYIDFADDSIVELSWEEQSTTDYSKPIYDIYPLSGHVVIKDKDLTLYNKAINGEFDQYDYPVEVIVGDKYYEYDGFAVRFYINALPEYSYEDKTLTLSLSDKLAKADELTYSGYDYPFEPQTLYTIAHTVLKSFDSSLNETEIENILPNSFKQITVEYPYIPDNISYRQAFRQILAVAQMSLVSDYILRYIFVNMDGHKDISLIYKTAILSNQMLSQFIPSIILANRYNVAEISSKKVVTNYYKNSLYTTNIYEPNTNLIYEGVTGKNTNVSEYRATDVATVRYSGIYMDFDNVRTFNGNDYLPVHANSNLKNLLAFTAVENQNPSYQLVIEKVVKRIQGTFDTKKSGSKYVIDPDTFQALDGAVEEIVSSEVLQIDKLNNSETFSLTGENGSPNITATLTFPITEKRYSVSYEAQTAATPAQYKNEVYILAQKVINVISGFWSGDMSSSGSIVGTSGEEGYKYTISYTYKRLSISYSGDYTEITFNDSTVSVKSGTAAKENKVAITTGGELMQYSGSTASSTSIPVVVANNTLDVFKNGLRGGDVEVVAWDYYAFDKNASGNYNKIINYLAKVSASKFFPIGHPVIPCKDQDRTPIMTKLVNNVKTPVVFMVVKNAITFNGGTFTQRLTLREVVE